MRVDLKVNFAEKDEAKRLGARWDAERKVWYLPHGVDANRFSKWIPRDADVTIRSSHYYIAQSETSCWKCGRTCAVFCFALPPGHETLERECDADEYGPAADAWYARDEMAFVQYVTDLPTTVVERIGGFTRHFRPDFSKTVGNSYWMNHCHACGMKQGDFELHCEPGGAFFPLDERDALRITLYAIAGPFSCNGDTSYSEQFDYAVKRA